MNKDLINIIHTLTPSEREYVRNSLNFAHALQGLQKKYSVSDEIMCQRFLVDKKNYQDFITGAYQYTPKQRIILNEFEINLSGE